MLTVVRLWLAVSLPWWARGDIDDYCLDDDLLPSTCTAENGHCASFRTPGIDLVIPTYEAELCKLNLLARSINVHDVCGLIRDVHIGWVSTTPLDDYLVALDRVAEQFGGPDKRKVHYYDRSERLLHNLEMHHGFTAEGWYEQQYFKLEAHSLVNTTWYLVLDSKNIFVNPITLTSLFSFLRNDLYRYQQIATKRWYSGAAEAMNVSIDDDVMLKATVTPFVFNTERVRALFEWLQEEELTQETLIKGARNHNHKGIIMTEFTIYETFTCCHPSRRGEHDPWRDDLPVKETWANPHLNMMTFRGALSPLTLSRLAASRSDAAAWNKVLLVGWHKDFPPSNGSYHTTHRDNFVANKTFHAEYARELAAMYRKGGIIRDDAEECDFFTNCANAVVACDEPSPTAVF